MGRQAVPLQIVGASKRDQEKWNSHQDPEACSLFPIPYFLFPVPYNLTPGTYS